MQHVSRSHLIVVVLCLLCIWHAAVRAQGVTRAHEGAERHEMLRTIDSLLEQTYALPDRAKEYAESFHRLWSTGMYDSIPGPKAFAERVTADLRAITKDRHFLFRVVESSDIAEKAESALHHPVRYYRMRIKENTGFSRVEWLDGNIGLLELRRFNAFSEAKEMIMAAMTLLSHANAIILDLRENHGGSGDYLSSYFLKRRTPLTGWYSRQDDFLTEFSTLSEPGLEPLTEVPIFVLTSPRTFSAAESFAYDMKVYKRAILVGEPTGGGSHSVDLFKVGRRFEIYIPTARAVNPLTGSNWEGTGVLPDVAVPAASAMDTALSLAREAGRAFDASREGRLKRAINEMEFHMENAESLYRNHRLQAGKAALDSLFSIGTRAGLVTEFFVVVLAYNFTSKEDAEILYAILHKNIELFPGSPTAYETLAYAYFKNGEKERAIENYRKVLALDAGNPNAAAMVRRLER